MRKVLILRIIVTLAVVLLSSQLLAARELTDKEKKMISDAIREKLLDSESARFKWLELSELQYCRPEAISCTLNYCGLVNSKNTFGGYAGDAPYLVGLMWMKRPLFSAPVLFLFLKPYLDVIAKNSLLMAGVIGIGDANWHSPESQTLLMMCAKLGYKKLYLAK